MDEIAAFCQPCRSKAGEGAVARFLMRDGAGFRSYNPQMPASAAGPSAVEICSSLIERYFDVIDANHRALDRLEAPPNRDLALELGAEYERSARLLTELVFELGGQPPTHGDMRRVVTEAKVALAEIAGDRGVLGALKSNEKGLCSALERAVASPALPQTLQLSLQEELGLVRSHLVRLDERLEELRDSAHVLS
jgi:hypothetical protein